MTTVYGNESMTLVREKVSEVRDSNEQKSNKTLMSGLEEGPNMYLIVCSWTLSLQCRNQNSKCTKWAIAGECEGNPGYMQVYVSLCDIVSVTALVPVSLSHSS
jgi:hypothetical protein